MKKEKLFPVIMAIATVSVLFLAMCDVFLRFITKNIVYDKMNLKNKGVEIIIDGLVIDKEGSDTTIRWNELYPRIPSPQAPKEASSFPLADRYDAFSRRIGNSVGKYADIVEYYCNDGLRNQSEIAELAAVYDNLIGWNLTIADDALVVNENGYIDIIQHTEVPAGEIVQSVKELSDLTESIGSVFCYVQIPSNVCKYENDSVGTYYDYSNDNADRLLEGLAAHQINYIDLRESLHAAGIDHRDAYYRTDCHWKTTTAFWAAGVITEYLSQNSSVAFDPAKFDMNQYETILYENSFLGGNGRSLTLMKADPEDFELILPVFDTAFTMEIQSKQMHLEGNFREVFIFDGPLTSNNYYGEDPYDSYRTRNYPLIRIHNTGADNNRGKRLLIIRDSYSAPLIPYLATDIEYVDCLYLQTFDGSVREYILQTQPDIVMVAYYPKNIQPIEWDMDMSFFDFR